MPNITCTITRVGRFDEFGRPLIPGQSYTGVNAFVRDLCTSGFAYVSNSMVFDDDDTPAGAQWVQVKSDGLLVAQDQSPVSGDVAVKVDVCVYGATPGGVMAAIGAARAGAKVALISNNGRIGGLTTAGLSWTDANITLSISQLIGLGKEFYTLLADEYGLTLNQFYQANLNHEPKIATLAIGKLLQRSGVNVVLNGVLAGVTKVGTRITSADFTTFSVSAKQYVDATYEGDLVAAAGCTVSIGRESAAQYGEANAGITPYTNVPTFPDGIDPYVTPGVSGSGLIAGVSSESYGTAGSAHGGVMAFNYRLCVTIAAGKITMPQPSAYSAAQHELMGRFAAASGGAWTGLSNIAILQQLKGASKYDMNAVGAYSTNYVSSECTEWVTATPARRAVIAENIKQHILGWWKFCLTDSRVNTTTQGNINSFGLCADEFFETGGFSPEVYVREGRRLVGDNVLTQTKLTTDQFYTNSIARAYYAFDCHPVRRVYIPGVGVKNEGQLVGIFPSTFATIPLWIIYPKVAECTNVVATFATSVTHVAFCSLRMEPIHMAVGHAAGANAALAARYGCNTQAVTASEVQKLQGYNGTYDKKSGAILNTDATYADGTLTTTGSWSTGSGFAGYVGGGYTASAAVGATQKFAPNLPKTGAYDVYVKYPGDATSTRSAATVVTVSHAGGTTTETLDQSFAGGMGGDWDHIGTFVFNKGAPSAHYVQIGTDGAGGSSVISAVKWVPVK